MKAKKGYRRERLDRGVKARCDTIFMLTSYRETLYMMLPRVIPVAAMLLLPLALGLSGQVYWQKVMIITCVISVLALSWDYLASLGLVSLGQAFFFGTGGFISGALNHYFGWSPLWTIPVATLGGGLICTAVLAPVLRLKGIYFSMITLALPLLVARVIEATRIFGGTEGLASLTPLPNIWVASYLIIGVLLVCLFGLRRLINTDYGLVLRGIKDNDQGIMASGTNIYRARAEVVFITSMIGAFTGAFMAHHYRFVGIPAFALDISILPVASALLGGMGTFAGATLGAFILVPLSEMLRALGTLRIVLYCLIMVGCIVGLPEGIFHYIERKYHQFERWVSVEREET